MKTLNAAFICSILRINLLSYFDSRLGKCKLNNYWSTATDVAWTELHKGECFFPNRVVHFSGKSLYLAAKHPSNCCDGLTVPDPGVMRRAEGCWWELLGWAECFLQAMIRTVRKNIEDCSLIVIWQLSKSGTTKLDEGSRRLDASRLFIYTSKVKCETIA